MYRGKDVLGEESGTVYGQKYRKTLLYALWGSSPPSVLKGFSLGIHAFKKRGMVFFWGIKKYGQICLFDRGKNV